MRLASSGKSRVSRGEAAGVAEMVRGFLPVAGIRRSREAFNAWALKFWEWRSLKGWSGSHLPHTHHPGAIRSAFLLRLTRLQAPLVGGYFFARSFWSANKKRPAINRKPLFLCLPFVGRYRTLCAAPPLEVRGVPESMRKFGRPAQTGCFDRTVWNVAASEDSPEKYLRLGAGPLQAASCVNL